MPRGSWRVWTLAPLLQGWRRGSLRDSLKDLGFALSESDLAENRPESSFSSSSGDYNAVLSQQAFNSSRFCKLNYLGPTLSQLDVRSSDGLGWTSDITGLEGELRVRPDSGDIDVKNLFFHRRRCYLTRSGFEISRDRASYH